MHQKLSQQHLWILKLWVLLPCFLIACSPLKKESPTTRANRYLLKAQGQDGSWDPLQYEANYTHADGKIAISSFAAMALLAQEDKKYQQATLKTLQFLRHQQKASGSIGEQNYANAVALCFLSRAYKKGILKEKNTLENLVQYMLKQQNAGGGWDYAQANLYRNDMSISAWVCMGFGELRKIEEYKEVAEKVLITMNTFLNRDNKGAGDNSITTEAIAAYAYGADPNSTAGRVLRNPGSTGQTIVLYIKSTIKDFLQTRWVEVATEDQETSFTKAFSTPTTEELPFCLYKAFFLLQSQKNGVILRQRTPDDIKKLIYRHQEANGSFSPNSPPVKFGGRLMSTALASLILQDL